MLFEFDVISCLHFNMLNINIFGAKKKKRHILQRLTYFRPMFDLCRNKEVGFYYLNV